MKRMFGLLSYDSTIKDIETQLHNAESRMKPITGRSVTLTNRDYAIFQDVQRLKQRMVFLPKIKEYADNNEWQLFSDTVQGVFEIMPYAFRLFYSEMPNEFRRDFVVGCYIHHGDSIPACRRAIRMLPKNGIKELPSELAIQPYIVVYRAGEEPIEKAPYRISWTCDERIARFFFREYENRRAQFLYKAKIRPVDVIAFTNEREEMEILQYRKVYDVRLIEMSEGGFEH